MLMDETVSSADAGGAEQPVSPPAGSGPAATSLPAAAGAVAAPQKGGCGTSAQGVGVDAAPAPAPAPTADAAASGTAPQTKCPRPKDRSKRSVAIHTGYVGTGYKGSSINRTLGDDVTIEQVLEKALFAAGCISEANFGSFSKIRWSRASRTDKGVHSLGTVMGLRMLVDDACYTTAPGADPEGLAAAEAVNAHLPPQIRVFCVQRTNKKFSARHMCEGRVYQYYLPASLIDLKCDGSEEDAARLAAFRDALKCFEGAHPFHNYTRRQVYQVGGSNVQFKPGRAFTKRKREDDWDKGKQTAPDAAAGAAAEAAADGATAATDAAADGAAAAPTAPPADGDAAAAAASAAAAAAAAAAAEGAARKGAQADEDMADADGAAAGAGAGAEQAATGEDGSAPAAAGVSDAPAAAAVVAEGQEQQPQREARSGDGGGGEGSEPGAKRARREAPAAAPPAAEADGEGAAVAGAADDGVGARGGRGRSRGRGGRDGGGGRGRGGGGGGRRRGSDDEDDDEEDDEEGGGGELDDDDDEAAGAEERRRRTGAQEGRYGPEGRALQLVWQTEVDPRDRVTQTHYRRIHSFTAADPAPLVEGGTPCLLLEVSGQSFMLHHIRHMIGTAVAVTLGLVPRDVLLGSLNPQARVSLPRAPPHTLLLADCSFGRFPHQYGPGDNDLRNMTGERLTIRAGGIERREAFRRDVLLPALQSLVELPEWKQWRQSLEACYPFPQEGLEPFLAAYLPWRDHRAAKRARYGLTGPGDSSFGGGGGARQQRGQREGQGEEQEGADTKNVAEAEAEAKGDGEEGGGEEGAAGGQEKGGRGQGPGRGRGWRGGGGGGGRGGWRGGGRGGGGRGGRWRGGRGGGGGGRG